MKKPAKYLTVPFLVIMFSLLVFKVGCKKDENPDEFHLSEKEKEITERLSEILPNTFLTRLNKKMEEYSEHPDYEEYVNELLDITSALQDSIEKYYSLQEFKEAVEKFYADFYNPLKSGIGCDIGNFGLGYAKGIAISAEITSPLSLEILSVLENQYGGGIELIYDFVNMTSQIYTYSLCGSGSDELSYELKLALTASLGLTGYIRWFKNTPYMAQVHPNLFAGSSRTTSYHLSAEAAKGLGIGVDMFVGKTQELDFECGFTYNLQQCEELQIQPPKLEGIRGIVLGATAQGSAGAALAIGLSSNALGQCYNGNQTSFVDYAKVLWFSNRMGAGLKMAASLLSINPLDGVFSSPFPTDILAAAAAVVYGFVDIEDCNNWSLPHVLVYENIEVINAASGLYKAEGLLIDNGGSSIIEKGIALSTSTALPPYYSLFYPSSDEGDAFEVYITDLEPNHTYLVTAYAENKYGLAYGNEFVFTTESEDGDGVQHGDGVTDIDGNFYPSVIIGNQEWMAENLKTTKYRNGVSIEYPGTDNTAWENNTTGAYAWHNNDIAWKDSYGALYNWHAVNNSNGLCPTGWHVPSHDDWTQLEQYICNQLGNENCETQFPYDNTTFSWRGTNEGNALKSCRQVSSPLGGDCATTEHPRWNSHSTTHYGTDDFGFSALPGGFRNIFGSHGYVGDRGYWWCSTEYSTTYAWCRALLNVNGSVFRHYGLRGTGVPVRCVRDID